MKRGYASTPEGQIHYYDHGRGAPLLLLHETPRSIAQGVFIKYLMTETAVAETVRVGGIGSTGE